MSHPDPNAPPDLTPIRMGEIWDNPVTGEHRHPGVVERFTVLEGELTVKHDGKTSILREGESEAIEANGWHDWWNAADRDALVRVEVTPGERFAHMIETLFGL